MAGDHRPGSPSSSSWQGETRQPQRPYEDRRVRYEPKCDLCASLSPLSSHEPCRILSGEPKAEAVGTSHSAQHLCIPFPAKWCSFQSSPACPPGDCQRLTLLFQVYNCFWSVEPPVTWEVSSEGKTNPNEIPERSAPRTGAGCRWKCCLQKGWKSRASNQKCNKPWPVSQGRTSHGPQGLLLSLLTLLFFFFFAKSPKVVCSSGWCIKLPKSDT